MLAAFCTSSSRTSTTRPPRCGRSREPSRARLDARSRIVAFSSGASASVRSASSSGGDPAPLFDIDAHATPPIGRPPSLGRGGQDVPVGRHRGQQGRVRTHRRDDPVGQQRDPVGQRDRARPVHDQDRGRAVQHPGERLLHQRLGVDVQGRQRVVQHEQAGLAEHGPGQRQPLPLAAGERQPLLADPGGQPGRQVVHEVGLGDRERLGDLGVGRVPAAEREVLPHAHREQGRLLERDPDHRAQRVDRDLARCRGRPP